MRNCTQSEAFLRYMGLKKQLIDFDRFKTLVFIYGSRRISCKMVRFAFLSLNSM